MTQTLLQITDICKTYGQQPVLQGINLTIQQGEIVSLLGVNGAGKTTLSAIIATLHPPTSGDIKFKGVSIYHQLAEFRRKLGFCPQQPNLNGMLTLEQNLQLAGQYYGLSREQAQARLQELAAQFELTRYLPQKAGVLSGGYQQRFMIARSLIHAPEFIILDEPTVGLDPHIRRNLWALILALKAQGITVLLTTHYLDEAEQLSDRVCMLAKGRIQLIDTPERLLAEFKRDNLEDVFIELLQEN